MLLLHWTLPLFYSFLHHSTIPHSFSRHAHIHTHLPIICTLSNGPLISTIQPPLFQDNLLREAVIKFNGKAWKRIAEYCFPDGARDKDQCLQRWRMISKPRSIKGPWTPEVRALAVSPLPTPTHAHQQNPTNAANPANTTHTNQASTMGPCICGTSRLKLFLPAEETHTQRKRKREKKGEGTRKCVPTQRMGSAFPLVSLVAKQIKA